MKIALECDRCHIFRLGVEHIKPQWHQQRQILLDLGTTLWHCDWLGEFHLAGDPPGCCKGPEVLTAESVSSDREPGPLALYSEFQNVPQESSQDGSFCLPSSRMYWEPAKRNGNLHGKYSQLKAVLWVFCWVQKSKLKTRSLPLNTAFNSSTTYTGPFYWW